MAKAQKQPLLPGEPDRREQLERMIRVDHAGEYGAKRIYEGQLAILGKTKSAPLIEEMKQQEEAHLEAFEALVRKEKVRPTALLPLWHVGGFMLGAATAMMGEKAAMACTVAVESVIDEHYRKQEETLHNNGEDGLEEMVAQFRAEEQEHHDLGLQEGAKDAPLFPLIHGGVSAITRAAIFLSKRL